MIEHDDNQPRADDGALATAAAPLPTERLRPLVAIAGALLMQTLFCVFYSQLGGRPGNGVGRFWIYWCGGTLHSQPMLIAIGAVFGPGRWLVRFACGLTVVAALAHLMNFGRSFSGVGGGGELVWVVLFILTYLLLQAPLLGVRWWWRWRIASRGAGNAPRTGRMQFSLRRLLAVATVACVVLAAWRWTYVPISLPDTPAGWWTLFQQVWLVALPLSGVSLAALPLVGAAMGTGYRGRSLALAVVGLVAAGGFYAWLMGTTSRDSRWVIACLLPSGWVWILLNLLVLRWGGFRLLQDGPDGTPAVEDAALTNHPDED